MLRPLALLLTIAAQDGAAPPRIEWTPHVLELSDGRRVEAELGRLTVPERRAAPGSRAISLAVIRLRSRAARPAPPVVYLDGSPSSVAASRALLQARVFALHDSLRAAGDVIVLDYRGSGLSTPRLDCPAGGGYPPDAFRSRADALAMLSSLGERCAASLRASGADLAGYTWAEIAGDVADLRRALGVPRVSIVGFSSGTHAALAFVRGHASEVHRLVLVGTEGPDHTRKLPGGMDRQIARLAASLRADPAWRATGFDLEAAMRAVHARLDSTPAIVEVRAPGRDVPLRGRVGSFGVRFVAGRSLAGPEEWGIVPLLYATLARGEVSVLQRVVQRFVERPPPSALAYLLDGASGVSPARLARIRREEPASLLGDALNFPFPEIGRAWGYAELPAAFREPVHAPVPTLFVTGTLDGNTPVEQAEEVRRGFPNGVHLLIEGGGHAGAFVLPEARGAIVAHLLGRPVPGGTVRAPPPRLPPPPR